MFLRHLTGRFRGFSRKHGRISKGAGERPLNTNPREMSPRVSTSFPTNFHAFSIPFRKALHVKMTSVSLSLSIQISSMRKNNNALTSVIYNPFDLISRYTNIRVPSRFPASVMIRPGRGRLRPSHRTRKPFYITTSHQKDHALRENYASELHQVIILRLSRVGRTSCDLMVSHGRVHFILFQNIIFFCIKS